MEKIIKKYSLENSIEERIVDSFINYHFSAFLPDYQMQSLDDISIDPYLSGQEAWDNLPIQIEEFKSKLHDTPMPG